jgi:hypothetical protein
MTAYIFDTVLRRGVTQNQVPALTQKARNWFRDTAQNTRVTPTMLINKNQSKLVNRIEIGKLYLYGYDPKMKQELPYYDRFPLVFPFRKASGGFYGINMHYLPYRFRAKLMDELYNLTTNKTYDESTKLRLNYNILNGVTRFRFFKPCVKHYLSNHVTSRFLLIDSKEWDIALFLPVERFAKATKEQVWKDSTRIINGV